MKLVLNKKTVLGFALALSVLLVITLSSYRSTMAVSKSTFARAEARNTLFKIDSLLSLVKDAETGQRGYLLTKNEQYLAPYLRAIKEKQELVANLKKSLEKSTSQTERLRSLEGIIEEKFAELGRTIELSKQGNYKAALVLVTSNVGQAAMDRIRLKVDEMKQIGTQELSARSDLLQKSLDQSVLLHFFGSLVAFLLVITAILLVNRDLHKRLLAEEKARKLNSELELRIAERTRELETKSGLLETVLAQMPTAVIVAEAPSGKLVLSNPQVQAIWRHPLIKSQNINDYVEWIGFHADGRRYAGSDWPLARALNSGEVVRNEDTDVQFGDGALGIIRLSAAPIRGEDGDIVAAIVICEDVTERKKTEEARIRALSSEKAAIESARLKSEFLANMSHEIRTPLNGILGMTDLLLDTALTEVQKKYARIVHDSGNGLLTVVNDILDFSKVEAGKIELELIDFNPVRLVEGQADLLASRAKEKNISLMSFVDPRIPAYLKGDPGRLSQVLLNLVGNAIKFTEKGSVVTRAILESQTAESVIITFKVEDTGIGLSEASRKKLFQPFTQADGSTARKYGGTGLGLSISKKLVELMGSEIYIESVEGQGSTFLFTCQFGFGHGIEQPHYAFSGDLSDLKVLVVDDDPPAGEIISHYLEKWLMKPTSVNSGRKALEALQGAAGTSAPYKLALVDNRMPEMDGITLAEKVRAIPALSQLKLILVTAFDKQLKGDVARKAGFFDSLSKPLKQSELYNCIVNTMTEKSTQSIESPQSRDSNQVSTLAPSGALKKILVAEDNQVNQMLALAQLKNLGYSGHAVANGREAVEAFHRGAYDLILMDCQMPEMDGFEATRIIRKYEQGTDSRIPIIALTANAMKEDEARCLESGMDGYLSKPVKKERILELLKLWLEDPKKTQTKTQKLG